MKKETKKIIVRELMEKSDYQGKRLDQQTPQLEQKRVS